MGISMIMNGTKDKKKNVKKGFIYEVTAVIILSQDGFNSLWFVFVSDFFNCYPWKASNKNKV